MIKIGLTGGIGSGKSTVKQLFERHGIQVVDADQVARDVVQPGEAGQIALQTLLGNDFFTNQQLERAKLRDALFTDPQLKQQVESILHPMIRERLFDQMAACTDPLIIIEIPLLVETEADYLDYVIVTDCNVDTQIERTLTRRDYTKEQVTAIIEQQATRAERLHVADWVIDTEQGLAQVEQAVEKTLAELYALANHN